MEQVAWLPLGNSRNSMRHPSQVQRIINFSTSNWGKFRVTHIVSGWEWFPVFYRRGKPTFHKNLKRRLNSAIGMWEGLCFFCFNWNGPRDALNQKKAGFPCSGLNAGSSFISQEEGMFESPVGTLEKALGVLFFWTGGLTSLWHLEMCAEFNASKGEDAWLILKIDRNTNITVPTTKGRLAFRLTSRSIRIVLPTLI